MHEVLDWIYSLVVALFLAMVIHIFLFVPTKVSGESMYPTLKNGEYLIVSKISHVLREMPNYGDIVIIDSRTHRERSWMDDLDEPLKNYIAIFDKSSQGHNVWVKRVIGKGGDKLEFKNGHVYRNGNELDEPYIHEPMEFSMDGSYTVPEGMVFVMGDNRNHSSDSRFIGPVPVDHVLGKVAFQFG
ncbi:signal peptidase I [uncultured Dialister sp.]|uniref:signal peptidase I n=1 Tax=uncultured Dialister sp. TaxID=278064 RepID=UPI002620FA78|nr:signal peptidase I [uncultured Dialister sp.]